MHRCTMHRHLVQHMPDVKFEFTSCNATLSEMSNQSVRENVSQMLTTMCLSNGAGESLAGQ